MLTIFTVHASQPIVYIFATRMIIEAQLMSL